MKHQEQVEAGLDVENEDDMRKYLGWAYGLSAMVQSVGIRGS